jgi:RNA polymerase primary sigma factor
MSYIHLVILQVAPQHNSDIHVLECELIFCTPGLIYLISHLAKFDVFLHNLVYPYDHQALASTTFNSLQLCYANNNCFYRIITYWLFLLACLSVIQVLKMMYRAPATSSYHQSAWAKISRTVNPYIHRYAPFLETPISAVQRWWLR